MSRLIKIGAGVCAVAIAVVLGVVLLPQLQVSVSAGKQAVAKPVFVAPPAAIAAAPAEPAKDAALVKLAEALRVTPAANALAAPPLTRSLAFAAADNSKASPAVAASISDRSES